MRAPYSDTLRREDNYIKLYKFTCCLPPKESYMLSYLIDTEAFVKNRMVEDPDYFECDKSGFISSKLTGWSIKEISNAIQKLAEKGLIDYISKNDGFQKHSYIKLNHEVLDRLRSEYTKGQLHNEQKGNSEDTQRVINQEQYQEQSQEQRKEEPSPNEEVKEIIDYLNKVCGTSFRYGLNNSKFITARLAEGFTVADCKRVIDIKAQEWLGDTEWGKYLNPETLFRPSNFEKYLNQKPKAVKNTQPMQSSVSISGAKPTLI